MSAPEAGQAYRCPDGLVRWVQHESSRGIYSVLWLDEERKVWYWGGKYRKHEWPGGEPYPAPQPGDTYTLMGVYGQPREMVVS